MITTQHKLDAVAREIGMRKSVYPKLVRNGKMTQFEADRQLDIMRAIHQDYLNLAKAERGQIPLF